MRHHLIALIGLAALLWAIQAGYAGDTLSPADQQIYKTAFGALDAGSFDDAKTLAAQAKDPALGEVIHGALLAASDSAQPFTEYDQFLATHRDWPSTSAIRRQAERAMPDDLPSGQVLAWFVADDPLSGTGALRLANALAATGHVDGAKEVIRTAWTTLNMNVDEEEAIESAHGDWLRKMDDNARLDRLVWIGDEPGARRQMDRVDPGHGAVATARFKFHAMDKNAQASLAKVPASLRNDPGLIYERARYARKKGDYKLAAKLLDRTGVKSPYGEQWWPERSDAARRALDLPDARLAYRIARGHEAKDGPAFAEGEFLAGWIALRFLHDRTRALQHFTRLYENATTIVSKTRGAYWAGRAEESAGRPTLAKQWYAKAATGLATYYGQLAAQKLGDPDLVRFADSPAPSKEQEAAFADRQMVRIVNQLLAIGEPDRAKAFYSRLAPPGSPPLVYRMATDFGTSIGRPDFALSLAKSARRDGVELTGALFPVRSLPGGAGAEAALILAIIKQESAFDPGAVSPVGALGLMQLMPTTARTIANQSGVDYTEGALTRDPDYNIRLGAAYLNSLLDNFDGSYVLSVASYNAGPGRAKSWVDLYGDPRDPKVDAVDWVERIPFNETRNYVQRVMENLFVYRARLQPTLLALRLEQDLKR